MNGVCLPLCIYVAQLLKYVSRFCSFIKTLRNRSTCSQKTFCAVPSSRVDGNSYSSICACFIFKRKKNSLRSANPFFEKKKKVRNIWNSIFSSRFSFFFNFFSVLVSQCKNTDRIYSNEPACKWFTEFGGKYDKIEVFESLMDYKKK